MLAKSRCGNHISRSLGHKRHAHTLDQLVLADRSSLFVGLGRLIQLQGRDIVLEIQQELLGRSNRGELVLCMHFTGMGRDSPCYTRRSAASKMASSQDRGPGSEVLGGLGAPH